MSRGYGVMPETFSIADRSLARRLITFAVPDGEMQRLRDLRHTDEVLYDAIRALDRFGSVDGPLRRTSTDLTSGSKKDLLTVREVADMLGNNPNHVRRLIRAGRLTALHTDPYLVTAQALHDYRAARAA